MCESLQYEVFRPTLQVVKTKEIGLRMTDIRCSSFAALRMTIRGLDDSLWCSSFAALRVTIRGLDDRRNVQFLRCAQYDNTRGKSFAHVLASDGFSCDNTTPCLSS